MRYFYHYIFFLFSESGGNCCMNNKKSYGDVTIDASTVCMWFARFGSGNYDKNDNVSAGL